MEAKKPQDAPLRVMMLIGAYAPVVGGGERHAQLLSEALVAQGQEVTVLTRRTQADFPREEVLHGVRVRRVGPSGMPRWGKYLMMPAAAWYLWRHRHAYDVLQVCAFRVLGWVGGWISLTTGKAVVLRAEACGEWSGAFTRKEKPNPVLRGYLAVRNRVLLRCDRFLSISRVIREEYVAGGIPEEKILEITNGIDLQPFRPAGSAAEQRGLREALGLPVAVPCWCYLGKLIEGKGLTFLLQLFAEMRRTHPELHLVLIGAGGGQFLDCEAELRTQVADLGLQGAVTFTGYTTRVPEWLRACDGLLFPSEAESLGLAAVEAMASGIPVLVSDVGGLKDVVTHDVNGMRLPPKDLDAWQRAWTSLLGDPERSRRLAQAGRERAVAGFDIREIAQQTTAAFSALTQTPSTQTQSTRTQS